MSENYFPVRLNTIRPNQQVTFDIYLKVGERFIHYTHNQDLLEAERLKNLKTKGVRKLFILAKDEDTYLKYLEEGINNLADKSIDMTTRAALAHDTMVMAVENAEKNLDTEEGYNKQKDQLSKIAEFVVSDRNALKGMLAAAGISVDNNQHSATVSSLSLAVASKCGITDKTELFELGTAALLHDIGKSRLKFDAQKPRDKMTPEEFKQFKNHPRDGADMLAGKPYISPRILGLVSSHEEMGEGRGFPEKTNIFKQPLPYQILSMVNQFEHFAAENKLPFQQAIDPFFEKYGTFFPEELITTLATVLT